VLVRTDTAEELRLRELRPVRRTKVDRSLVAVGIPREEVTRPFVAASPDDEVDGANRAIIELALDGLDIQIVGGKRSFVYLLKDPPCRREQFRSTAVRECDVQNERLILACTLLGVVDDLLYAVRQAFDITECTNTDLVLVDAVGVSELAEFVLDEIK